ncbi:uncharacterized protein K452DRAFT_319617 [Aplosporella prunicola CBS 121167]|uniref:Mating-type alpha-pheromone receptor PreB n=1 Tax=Aplosporella prunicola CBS 121167 TaxID=1176127 RepID=A0A6A6BBJ6_9PEZI|nr:uncharacterized protein K452DRAFT_319617 [Aplosporella prunicola CBS 121167]KAF2140733.1 hypothetical protein K452DRAFT_319617 [Aplosporella prunicola CBS 121167]
MADQSTSTKSTGIDPFNQQITIVTEHGESVELFMSDIHNLTQYAIKVCINYASQLGASFVFLLLLLVLTKREKRRSPIFVFNILALAVNVVRSVLQCLYYTSPWYHPYAVFANDYSRVTRGDYATSATTVILQLVLCICIEISLVMQVHVVCITMERTRRSAVMILSSLVALTTIGLRFALTVVNVQYILRDEGMAFQQRISSAANISTSVSIWFFSIIFCAKLAFAIRNRRRLGLIQFGPMQIIFVMGCQTLIVPSIFSALQYGTTTPYLGSQVPTVVAIFLPLSAIWASVSTNDRNRASRGHDAHHKLLGNYSSDSGMSDTRNNSSSSTRPLTARLSPASHKTSETYTTFSEKREDNLA